LLWWDFQQLQVCDPRFISKIGVFVQLGHIMII